MKTQERVLMESRRIIALLLLVAATAGSALAGPTELYSGQTGIMPYLSDDGTKTMYINILFAVYDTSTGEYQGAPGPQQYVYVYIVQSQSNSEVAVDLFQVLSAAGQRCRRRDYRNNWRSRCSCIHRRHSRRKRCG